MLNKNPIRNTIIIIIIIQLGNISKRSISPNLWNQFYATR